MHSRICESCGKIPKIMDNNKPLVKDEKQSETMKDILRIKENNTPMYEFLKALLGSITIPGIIKNI